MLQNFNLLCGELYLTVKNAGLSGYDYSNCTNPIAGMNLSRMRVITIPFPVTNMCWNIYVNCLFIVFMDISIKSIKTQVLRRVRK